MNIIIICICVCFFFFSIYILNFSKQKYGQISKLDEHIEYLEVMREEISNHYNKLQANITQAEKSYNDTINKTQQLNEITQQRKQTIKTELQEYRSTLETQYNNEAEQIKLQCEQKKQKYKADAALVKEELDKIKATRDAINQAIIREQEVKEKEDFYKLPLNDLDELDINELNKIKLRLNKPRVLSMLIWSTYFQKNMTALCNKILGTNTICGIYKITNTVTKESYIGQAVSVADRWKQHAKYGLGIDTPLGNKLYKAMQEYGLQNFSWELLEQCERKYLDEKEHFYIDIYDTANFGYNSTKGNVKK